MNGLAEFGPCQAGFGYSKDAHTGLQLFKEYRNLEIRPEGVWCVTHYVNSDSGFVRRRLVLPFTLVLHSKAKPRKYSELDDFTQLCSLSGCEKMRRISFHAHFAVSPRNRTLVRRVLSSAVSTERSNVHFSGDQTAGTVNFLPATLWQA